MKEQTKVLFPNTCQTSYYSSLAISSLPFIPQFINRTLQYFMDWRSSTNPHPNHTFKKTAINLTTLLNIRNSYLHQSHWKYFCILFAHIIQSLAWNRIVASASTAQVFWERKPLLTAVFYSWKNATKNLNMLLLLKIKLSPSFT